MTAKSPVPTAEKPIAAEDAATLETDEVKGMTPVVFGLSNVILHIARTSDPANLAAVEPDGYSAVAPVSDRHFAERDAASALDELAQDSSAILVSEDMAGFLKTKPGDRIEVLLARATDEQVLIEMHIVGLFERLPGFPDGADALIAIGSHREHVPAKHPDFFLAQPRSTSDDGLARAVASLEQGTLTGRDVRIDTRTTTLAKDQSSLAALNIAGLVDLDGAFALAMAAMTMAIFVFGLLLHRRREYVTLRAQGLEPRSIRTLIAAEAGCVAIAGAVAGVIVGAVMGAYFVAVLRPLFILPPAYLVPGPGVLLPALVVTAAAAVSALLGSRLVQRLEPTELLRDE